MSDSDIKKSEIKEDFTQYDEFIWGSIDPRNGEAQLYPPANSNQIENSYIDYLTNPENNSIHMKDFYDAKIYFKESDYFVQRTNNGLRSVFRLKKDDSAILTVSARFNSNYNSWYLDIPKTSHIAMLVDTSGSMYNCYNLIIEKCIEEFLEKQKTDIDNKALFYGMTFNNKANLLYNGVDLKTQTDIRDSFYSIKPSGMTAYYDAYIEIINKINSKYKLNDEVVVCCMTDGEDNSSNYSKNFLKKTIDSYKKKGWVFAMFGTKEANVRISITISIYID